MPCNLLPEYSVTSDAIHCADWRVLLAGLPAQSVDLCLTDTPYGTTACAWDTVIDLAYWWREMKRVMKPRGAVVMTASQPYTSALVMSNPAWFKYAWVWDKGNPTGHLNANVMPLKRHEDVCVFGSGRITYEPIMTPYETPRAVNTGAVKTEGGDGTSAYGVRQRGMKRIATHRYPVSILYAPIGHRGNITHPTQKPVALFEYLIRTYTHEGALVLDPFVGSGTTAVAARNTKRRYVCGDVSAAYVAIARERVSVEPFAPIVADDDVSDLPLFAREIA